MLFKLTYKLVHELLLPDATFEEERHSETIVQQTNNLFYSALSYFITNKIVC